MKLYRRFLSISTYQQKTAIITPYAIKKTIPKTYWNRLFFIILEHVTSYLDYKTGSGFLTEEFLHLHANQPLTYHP